MRGCAHLLFQFFFEGLLALGGVGFVSIGIDEGVLVTILEVVVLLQHAEVDAVGAEEDVAGKVFENFELVLVVGGDLGIGLVADEFVAGIYVGAADDDDVKQAAAFLFVQRPGGGPLGVAGGQMRGQRGATQ